MKDNKAIDVYTENIIDKIDKDIRAGLTKEQITAVREAIQANRSFKKHGIDIRGIIPLFVSKYYFAFLLGRDRRSETKKLEEGRKKASSIVHKIFFLSIMLSPILLFLLIFLYILESLN